MSTMLAHIHLKPNAVPYARHTPIPAPNNWKKDVKMSIDRDVQREIITTVLIGIPVEWCAPMIVVAKKDGTPR